PASGLEVLQVLGAEGPALVHGALDRREERGREALALLLREPPRPPLLLVRHAVAQRRQERARHHRGLVAPMLEGLARGPQVVVEGGVVVGAEAREERQVVRPGQHVDAVELQDALPSQVLAEAAYADASARSAPRQALG